MLELRGIAVNYGAVVAVDGVDLTVRDGDVIALLGPSGCGKSTLLRAVAGLEPVAAGSICWDGADLAGVPVHRRGFGLMFQDGVLFPHRDVAGNIAYGLRFTRLGRDESKDRVAGLLELVGLEGYGPRRVSTLSGGEAQRVALARALAPRPRLLLLDEPLAALDRSLRERLLADLKSVLTSTATTALFVTHDQGEAFAVADRVAVMRSGSIRQQGTPREVWTEPADEWVARFVGYTSVHPAIRHGSIGSGIGSETRSEIGSENGNAIGVSETPEARLALRPAALVLDPEGSVHGRVVMVAPAPDGVTLTVDTGTWGVVQAVAGADCLAGVGERVRLRFDPAGAARIPA
ncbi:MAG TPA: ABC transporter ATP-binding protein [Nakamurella sp.]|nr:ABC transporter ATP-binding protein [Nakamurella sp.]